MFAAMLMFLSVSPSSLNPGLMYMVDVLTQSGVRADEFPSTSHSAGPLHFWTRKSGGAGVKTTYTLIYKSIFAVVNVCFDSKMTSNILCTFVNF